MHASIVQSFPGMAILAIVFLAQALKEMGVPSFGLTHSLLLYAGYQFSSGSFYFGIAIILFIFLGSLCGASLVFHLARSKYNKLLAILIRYSVVKPVALARARSVLFKSSFVTITIGRSLPGLMLPTSILAGSLDFSVSSFLTGILVTLSMWVFVIVGVGTTITQIIPTIKISSDEIILFLAPLVGLGVFSGGMYILKKHTWFQSRRSEL